MINTTFTDAKFLSAQEKQAVLRDFTRFCKFLASKEWGASNESNGGSDHGLAAPRVFTKRLYNHLHLHCGYIAHYNLHGFYSTYFSGDEDGIQSFFKDNTSEYGYGGWSWGEFTDIGNAMREVAKQYMPAILQQVRGEDDTRLGALKELMRPIFIRGFITKII